MPRTPSARYPQHYRRRTDARQGRTNLAEARREFAYSAGESFLLSSCLMGEALEEHNFATVLTNTRNSIDPSAFT